MTDHNNKKWPESHYDLNKLGKIFFFVCLFFLILIGFVVFKDYNKEWRFYQKKFRELEIKKNRKSLSEESEKLKKSQAYADGKKKLLSLKKRLQSSSREMTELHLQLKKSQDRKDKTLSQYQSVKGKCIEFKYKLGSVQSHYALGNKDFLEKKLKNLLEKQRKFKKNYDEAQKEYDRLSQELDKRNADYTKQKKTINTLLSRQKVLQKILKKIDPNSMDLQNKVASFVRDLPILDMLNPYYKIDQIVVKDIKEDLNFAKVPVVDRCVSCHKGIMKKGYENLKNPYKTHPHLDLYLSSDSLHPFEKFACTVCHRGNGRGLSFHSAAHTPNSEAQEKEWKQKYGWHKKHHCERPMLPRKHIQASCYQCHSKTTGLKNAEKLNLGLKLIEQNNCYACHKMKKYEKYSYPPGPNLTKMGSKLTKKDWVYHWIHNPSKVRPYAKMPAYFSLINNSDPDSMKRSEQEVLSLRP